MKKEFSTLQILLVDDDVQIRAGLEQIIRNHFPTSELTVISCENGLIASQLLQQESIDLLITDIKMPLYSGIELLQFINEHKIQCHSIVLSGYDDFNLVRNALRYGAKDYLLKPVEEELLIHIIHEVKTAVRRNKIIISEKTSAAAVLKKQKLLEACFSDSANTIPEFQDFIEKYHITKETPCLMCYVNIKRALYSNQFTMFQFLSDRLSTYLDSLPIDLSRQFHTICGGIGAFWIAVLFCPAKVPPSVQVLQPFLEVLKRDHLKYSYTSSWYTLSEIYTADALCKKSFESYYYDLPPRKDLKSQLTDISEDLTLFLNQAADAAASYDYANTIKNLEHCFSIYTIVQPPVSELKKQMNHFVYSILTRNAAFIPIISTEKFTEFDIFEQIANTESLSVLQHDMFLSINHLIESVLHSMKDKDDYVIQKAKEYIHNNYSDNISLNDVAAHVFLNGNYFSTLFKRKTGTTFRDYLRNYRIEKAKHLLNTTHLKIYEVGLQVGYNEQPHFVRAFKSVTGQTPGEFRDGQ